MNPTYIYRSNGSYLGFITDNYLYDVQGSGLGWVEYPYVWDKGGQFRGNIANINGNNYIIRNSLQISPVPREPKIIPSPTTLSVPPQLQIMQTTFPLGVVDAY